MLTNQRPVLRASWPIRARYSVGVFVLILMLAFLHIFMFSDSLSHFSASSVFDDGYKMMNPKIKIYIIWALTGAQEIFVFPVPVQVWLIFSSYSLSLFIVRQKKPEYCQAQVGAWNILSCYSRSHFDLITPGPRGMRSQGTQRWLDHDKSWKMGILLTRNKSPFYCPESVRYLPWREMIKIFCPNLELETI